MHEVRDSDWDLLPEDPDRNDEMALLVRVMIVATCRSGRLRQDEIDQVLYRAPVDWDFRPQSEAVAEPGSPRRHLRLA